MGRFFTVDPLSEKFSFQSPFVYAANNPIKFVDINGENAGDPQPLYYYKDSNKITTQSGETNNLTVLKSTKQIVGTPSAVEINGQPAMNQNNNLHIYTETTSVTIDGNGDVVSASILTIHTVSIDGKTETIENNFVPGKYSDGKVTLENGSEKAVSKDFAMVINKASENTKNSDISFTKAVADGKVTDINNVRNAVGIIPNAVGTLVSAINWFFPTKTSTSKPLQIGTAKHNVYFKNSKIKSYETEP